MTSKAKHSPAKLQLTDNALVVLERRYLARDLNGQVVETPDELFRRVAGNIAQAERLYMGARERATAAAEAESRAREMAGRFYDLMTSLCFLPNSPTLGNAGRPLQQLSACFVLPVEDSIAGIFETVKETALIHQSGGGTGFAFSRLRPAGDLVQSTMGVASGPVSFMKVFDAATEAIKQGGTRRGANMAILDVHHPDIEAFINVKADMVTLTNFNISVGVDNAFMQAVEDDQEYDLINPRTREVTGRMRARAVFDQIVTNAWQNGDPGLVFLDRINAGHPTPALGLIEATNPCGEQPLLPYESCNLGSLNLSKFVRTAAGTAQEQPAGTEAIDWDGLAAAVALAVRFLDDVIDMNAYPVEAIDRVTKSTRKIGLGVMGWAGMLFQLGIPYDSDAAIDLAGQVMAYIKQHADAASRALADERGVFPAWEKSTYGPDFADGVANGSSRREVVPLRNSTRTTIAPTGTLSIIAGCTGGIEPAFALAFMRQHFLDPKRPDKPVQLAEVEPFFAAAAREAGFYSDGLIAHLARGGSLQERDDVPVWAKRLFVTAHEIAPEWHVRMQAAFQRHTDNAVSKTINFPRAATIEDVAAAYRLAYREGCKGITIYRDGSRAGQVLTHIADGESDEITPDAGALEGTSAVAPAGGQEAPHRRRLADERQSITHKFRVGEQEGFVTVGLFGDGTPGEIFVTISKEGSTIRGLMDSVAMLTSYSLQYGVQLRTLVEKFRGVHFEPAGFTSNPDIPQASSLVDYIFRWLELKFLGREPGAGNQEQVAMVNNSPTAAGRPLTQTERSNRSDVVPASRRRRQAYLPPRPALPFPEIATGLLCPDCGSQLVFAEGCLVCRSCGFTKCG